MCCPIPHSKRAKSSRCLLKATTLRGPRTGQRTGVVPTRATLIEVNKTVKRPTLQKEDEAQAAGGVHVQCITIEVTDLDPKSVVTSAIEKDVKLGLATVMNEEEESMEKNTIEKLASGPQTAPCMLGKS